MAYSVNWISKLITIPLSDLVLVVDSTYELALSDFHKELRRLESAPAEGLWAPQMLEHVSPKTISGVVYAAFDEVVNDYTVQFAGAPDAVILKGSNNNILDVYVFNGVSVAPNNSTGLQDLSTLLISAYSNEVCYSNVKGISGTSIPIGTRAKPSDNWVDVESIADSKGISRIRILDNATLDATADFTDGHEITSDNALATLLTINSDANVTNCTFSNLSITGTLDGNNVVRDCAVHELLNVQGVLRDVFIMGKVSVKSGTQLSMMNCHSGVAGGGLGQTAGIDMGGDGTLRCSGYTGGINLSNCTGGGDISLDVEGRVIVESTCTAGDIYIRGSNCQVRDESTGTCTVHDQTNLKAINDLPFEVWSEDPTAYPEDSAGKIISDTSTSVNSLPSDIWSEDPTAYPELSTGGMVAHLRHLRYTLFVDTELAVDGDGSQHAPFNNETSAIDYAEAHGIKALMIMADITFTRQVKNFEIHGVGVPQIDLNGQTITGTVIRQCRPTGLYLGTATFQECNLNGLMTLNGYIENCAVSGNFQIPDGGTAFVKGTAALVAGQTKPVFDIGGAAGTGKLVLMDYDGGCTIENCNQATDDVKLVVNHGIIELDASCTDGNIFMFGDVELIRGDSGSTVFDWTKPPSEQKDILASVMYRRVTDELAKTITLYEKDGVAARKVFDYTENVDGAIIEVNPQ